MSEHPYLSGPYAPVDGEIDAELELIAGAVPRDLDGTYVRNGPNPRHAPRGRYHWFDGDGMLHAVTVADGRLRYRNRWVQTAGLRAEDDAGHALWTGLMESTRDNPAGAPYKDTANTDVLAHDGALLALWYICGAAHVVDPETLRTRGPARFGGDRPLRLSAHAKVDPATGDLLFFDYGPRAPFLRYGEVRGGELRRRVDVEVPGPRLPHDMAFTERFAVLMDLPVYPRPEALAQRRWLVEYHRDQPSRFALLPRAADGAPRWFEAEPCYVYHVVNAWEEGDEVVLVGCRCDDPTPTPDPADGVHARALANLRLRAHLHEWRFDLRTGATRERPLDDLSAEFPSIDARRAGRKSRYSYHVTIPRTPTLRFDGIVKYDLEAQRSERVSFGEGAYGSEAPFAPRTGATEEDDGYLLSFVHDAAADRSELRIYDARALEAGPITRAAIPQRVPAGFHATWVPAA